MSCYVDPLFVMKSRDPQAFRVGEKHGHQWCHLWADTLEELHAMAAKVGMKRAWFQRHTRLPHYDLVPPRRTAAVKAGAIEFNVPDWKAGKRPAALCAGCYWFAGDGKDGMVRCGLNILPIPPRVACADHILPGVGVARCDQVRQSLHRFLEVHG